jgi:hypothetical protein
MSRQRRIVDGRSFEPDRDGVVFAGLRAAVKPSVLPRASENLFTRLAERLLARAAALSDFGVQMTTSTDSCASAGDFIRNTRRLMVRRRKRKPL